MLQEGHNKIKMNKRREKVENMQKKLEHETVAGLMRKEEKKSHILKNSRGITLIALIVTIALNRCRGGRI